jgi:asparagine synthase (glutamine-hydrolysing)
MCGIAGIVGPGSVCDPALVRRMTDTLAHRGPDDVGTWADTDAGVGLGQRRLSIIDLSPEGHQPMASSSGRYVCVFNGEIYNFEILRSELEARGQRFRGHSDTEVMLAAFEEWGVEASVRRFNGMFAIALWDRRERTLFLVRDRFGKKPLYFGWICRVLAFGSELRALRAHPGFEPEVDRGAVALLLKLGYVPSPWSIYRRVYKLLPGSILRLSVDRIAQGEGGFDPIGRGPEGPIPFWSVEDMARRALAEPFRGGEQDALDQLDHLLRDATKIRMIADVPLGAFLSGGVDSSLVVALMQAQSARPVRTFSIGFSEKTYDEAPWARRVAAHLGTDHTDMYVTPDDVIGVVPKLPDLYDEPFADSSQIPTYLVSGLTRRHLTVALSGDGGDELFVGYNRYTWPPAIINRLRWVPSPFRKVAGSVVLGVSRFVPEAAAECMGDLLPKALRVNKVGEKLQKLGEAISVPNEVLLYDQIISYWRDGEHVVLGQDGRLPFRLTTADLSFVPDFAQRMMFWDLAVYLTDDNLAKVDRASMAVALETRAPLLDYRVAELASSMPTTLRARGNEKKWLLKQLLYRYVPQELVDRPKMGFSVPVGAWLRGPLRDWAAALLDERRIKEQGLLDAGLVRAKWVDHLAGKRNWQHALWAVLMLEAWIERYRTGTAAGSPPSGV